MTPEWSGSLDCMEQLLGEVTATLNPQTTFSCFDALQGLLGKQPGQGLWLFSELPGRAPAQYCSVVEGRLLAFGVSGKIWVKLHER